MQNSYDLFYLVGWQYSKHTSHYRNCGNSWTAECRKIIRRQRSGRISNALSDEIRKTAEDWNCSECEDMECIPTAWKKGLFVKARTRFKLLIKVYRFYPKLLPNLTSRPDFRRPLPSGKQKQRRKWLIKQH